MPGLRLFTSNRLETLAREMARELSFPLLSPLTPEVIVVQSLGMERWLAQTLASSLGVWGNARYPFPNMILKEFFEAVLPGRTLDSAFEPEVMALRLMGLFSAGRGESFLAPLEHYLGEASGDLKEYQLARRIADTFDQYGVFRPELLLEWQEEEGGGWQGDLWRALARGREGGHRAALRREFLQRVKGGSVDTSSLPARISVFGISYLPPLHLEALEALSRHIPITLYLMNPCREYWYEIASEREQSGRERRGGGAATSGDQHWEEGNPLLASLGRQGRDFLGRISGGIEDEVPCYRESDVGSLLHRLQDDILTLRHPREAPRRMLDAADFSLQVHSCHGPMREVEVLHDQLLDLLERLPGLEPRDILVMTPDIEGYAPYISAVFDGIIDPARTIPFSIADRSLRSESPLISAFLAILGLPGSRFGASQVLDILEVPAVCRRFGLIEADLEVVRRWIGETRIRWGIDAEDRERQGVPPFAENSWKSGLQRLLLGYALPGEGRRLFGDILPFDDVEGSETRVLGALSAFAGELFAVAESLEARRPLAEWGVALSLVAGRIFAEDQETERDLQLLQQTLGELPRLQASSGYGEAVDFRLVRTWVAERLESRPQQAGFLVGGVTFCAMQPMRSIPFRVIAMMGMNDGAFPRIARPPGFDLIAAHPQRGDRSKRDEDRYLFLEALLSARDHLHISYCGQSVRDNSSAPPSVVVSELLDAVEQGFEAAEGPALERVVIHHRLQGFSPAYFDAAPLLFSYSAENLKALQAHSSGGGTPPPFFGAVLPLPETPGETVNLRQLQRFFDNPSRFFLEERLGVTLGGVAVSPQDREPFALDSLEKYLLEQELVSRALDGETLAEGYPLMAGAGILPPGEPGAVLYSRLSQGALAFAGRVREFLPGDADPAVDIDLDLAGLRLVGRIEGGRKGTLVRYRYAKVKARDRLRLWLEHLVLAAADPGGESLLIASDRILRFRPVENPLLLLSTLLRRYREGLCRPLPLFGQASFKYAEAVARGTEDSSALLSARSAWQGGDYLRGDEDDPHHRLCYRHGDPLVSPFAELALEVFAPLFDHQEEG